MSHAWTMRFVQHRVADKRILRLIQKWRKARGERGRRVVGDEGRHSARSGDDGLNAKDNFEFDRMVPYRQQQEDKKR
jgi:hypothetical protein